jgi:Cu(I)/Ag(I) efflux system membrane fusion protein
MFVDINLKVDHGESIVIPDSAVMDSGTRQVVFVDMGGGRFEPRLVKTGARSDGKTPVLSGVKAQERVVVRANFLLDSESRLSALIDAAMANKK